MNSILVFWILFAVLLLLIVFLDKKYYMLRDTGTASARPYSFSRTQLAWWSLIILTSFATVLFTRNEAVDFSSSSLILLGITTGTSAAGRLIDISDQSTGMMRIQDYRSAGFLLDILSDDNGVSISRFQTVLFNLIFGIWYLTQVVHHLAMPGINVNEILPDISSNNLVLLGLSSGTYALLKTTENKQLRQQQQGNVLPEMVADEALTDTSEPAKG